MARRPHAALIAALLAAGPFGGLAACSGDDTLLLVDVRTDYAQVTEFDAIEVQAADQVVRHEVQALSDYGAGVRVAEITSLPTGPTLVAARLLLGEETIREESMSVTIADHTALTFEILRNCPEGSCADAGVPDGSVVNDGAAPDGAVGDAGIDAPTCTTTTMPLTVQSDTVLLESSCNGAIHEGASPVLNLGDDNAHGLFRFTLSGEMRAALFDGSVSGARLVLFRATDCFGASCPAAAGTLHVRPMRSDWDEGTSADYSGADWCRRTSGLTPLHWSSPGASSAGVDRGAEAGSATFGVDDSPIVVELDSSGLGDWANAVTGAPQLTFQTEATAAFVAAARENETFSAARFELDVCR